MNDCHSEGSSDRRNPPIPIPDRVPSHVSKVDAATETRRSGGNIFSVHIHTTPRGTISVIKKEIATYVVSTEHVPATD